MTPFHHHVVHANVPRFKTFNIKTPTSPEYDPHT